LSIPTAIVSAIVAFLLGIPHRLLWTRPAGRVTAGILARLWAACGIDRPAERAYATIVTIAVGGWLSAAIAAAPTTRPLPAVAVIGTLILGVPWWMHRRRRARVRIERTIAAWPDIAPDIGLAGSRIASVVVDAWGWTARVILKKGHTVTTAADKLPAIESALGLPTGSVRVLPDENRADRFVLRVIETDPHAHPIKWPGPSAVSIIRPIELGLFEDGRPVRVSLLRRNALIGGTTGSGKSGVLNVILAALAACPDVVIWGVDLKGGMELKPWAKCLDRLATTPEQAIVLFKDAIGELNQRAHTLARNGLRVWEPTQDNPSLVIVCDEYAELPDEAQDYADSIARRGRAVAVNLLAATQRPTQAAMGNNTVRSQMDVRICLRVRERRDVDLILSQGSFANGWHAHTITHPGIFLISAPDHTTPERARGYLISDDQVTAHATRCATDRPTLASHRASGPPKWPQTTDDGRTDTELRPTDSDSLSDPETKLWAALRRAGPEGLPVAALMAACGMGRSWVYYRLAEFAAERRAVQTSRGHWRTVTPEEPSSDRDET
jgi:S-DNA-T family DNA segregation ATPase FtsK/SpoIIIE